MLSITDAIVLSLQPLSDKAHILHAYTRTGGRVNYKVYGLGRKHPIGMYMPLSRIQITASCPTTGMPSVRETTVLSPSSFHLSPSKRAVALFLSEVLFHVLRHPMPDEPMFDFIEQAVQALDQTDEPQNFHLSFLIDFADKLGFKMENEPALPTTRSERQKQLQALCQYFDEHVETWQNPRSLDVLMEVFD